MMMNIHSNFLMSTNVTNLSAAYKILKTIVQTRFQLINKHGAKRKNLLDIILPILMFAENSTSKSETEQHIANMIAATTPVHLAE